MKPVRRAKDRRSLSSGIGMIRSSLQAAFLSRHRAQRRPPGDGWERPPSGRSGSVPARTPRAEKSRFRAEPTPRSRRREAARAAARSVSRLLPLGNLREGPPPFAPYYKFASYEAFEICEVDPRSFYVHRPGRIEPAALPEPGPEPLSGAGRGRAPGRGRGGGRGLAAEAAPGRARPRAGGGGGGSGGAVQRRGDWLRRAETSGSRGLSGSPARRGAVGSSAHGSEEVSSAVPPPAAVAGLRRSSRDAPLRSSPPPPLRPPLPSPSAHAP